MQKNPYGTADVVQIVFCVCSTVESYSLLLLCHNDGVICLSCLYFTDHIAPLNFVFPESCFKQFKATQPSSLSYALLTLKPNVLASCWPYKREQRFNTGDFPIQAAFRIQKMSLEMHPVWLLIISHLFLEYPELLFLNMSIVSTAVKSIACFDNCLLTIVCYH